MAKTIKIKDILGKVLFEYKKENNTLKDTLIEAILSKVNLYGADLRGTDLRYANLQNANLQGVYLSEADLYGANLECTDLHYANLYTAHLYEANLQRANLFGTDLVGAGLYKADLRGADLYGANLECTDLHGADLRGANFCRDNLNGTYINKETKFDTESLIFAETRFLPEGDIIGYKKCRNNVIVKLLIPKEAKRSHAFGRKCRAEYAQVLEIFGATIATSKNDSTFTYKVGDTVRPEVPFSEDWFQECESGIHFFITRIEAEQYES